MSETVHVVEPTLEDEAGHCHSFLEAVCAAGPEHRFEMWAGRNAGPLFGNLPQIALYPHFRRRLRRPQALLLYRRLLRAAGRVFVPTAGATDLALIQLAAAGELPPHKVALFFHWIRPGGSRQRRMARVARRQPNLTVLGATPEIVGCLEEAGFARARLVPYPVVTRARPAAGPAQFRHLLFAGAARRDKGFRRVVDLVERLAAADEEIPVAVQTSARHYGKLDPAVASDLERLTDLAYPGLQAYPDTLESSAYLELFHGAICLQPYQRAEFAGRVSAITVDALASGCPVITTAGTWMARCVEELEAGVVLEDPSGAALHAAARQLIGAYERYSANARKAAEVIGQRHSGAHLLAAVLA